MKSSIFMIHNRLTILSTTKSSRRCLHTCLPLMSNDVQPHMRVEAKSVSKEKRTYGLNEIELNFS